MKKDNNIWQITLSTNINSSLSFIASSSFLYPDADRNLLSLVASSFLSVIFICSSFLNITINSFLLFFISGGYFLFIIFGYFLE